MKTQVDVPYFGFRKALDRVNIDKLFLKIDLAGFAAPLLHFFCTYFEDRMQYVEYERCKSSPYVVTFGIDLNLVVLDLFSSYYLLMAFLKSSVCLMFADDVKLYMPRRCARKING